MTQAQLESVGFGSQPVSKILARLGGMAKGLIESVRPDGLRAFGISLVVVGVTIRRGRVVRGMLADVRHRRRAIGDVDVAARNYRRDKMSPATRPSPAAIATDFIGSCRT